MKSPVNSPTLSRSRLSVKSSNGDNDDSKLVEKTSSIDSLNSGEVSGELADNASHI
ncbi:hypothetical protein ACH5RR_007184, partial [Cinchona calisaya]